MKLKSGLAFHIHHDNLVGWCYDYDERVAAIKAVKPADEINTRLRLFQLLPKSVILPENVQEAYAKWEKTDAKWEEAYAEYLKLDTKYRKGDAKEEKLHTKCQRAETKRENAVAEWKRALSCNAKFFEKLHTKFCDCTEWNGEKIMFS